MIMLARTTRLFSNGLIRAGACLSPFQASCFSTDMKIDAKQHKVWRFNILVIFVAVL